jgi:hypothetical protein
MMAFMKEKRGLTQQASPSTALSNLLQLGMILLSWVGEGAAGPEVDVGAALRLVRVGWPESEVLMQ